MLEFIKAQGHCASGWVDKPDTGRRRDLMEAWNTQVVVVTEKVKKKFL